MKIKLIENIKEKKLVREEKKRKKEEEIRLEKERIKAEKEAKKKKSTIISLILLAVFFIFLAFVIPKLEEMERIEEEQEQEKIRIEKEHEELIKAQEELIKAEEEKIKDIESRTYDGITYDLCIYRIRKGNGLNVTTYFMLDEETNKCWRCYHGHYKSTQYHNNYLGTYDGNINDRFKVSIIKENGSESDFEFVYDLENDYYIEVSNSDENEIYEKTKCDSVISKIDTYGQTNLDIEDILEEE